MHLLICFPCLGPTAGPSPLVATDLFSVSLFLFSYIHHLFVFSNPTLKWKHAIFFFLLMCVYAQLLQLCLTLCDSMDCSLSGSSICGILQARIQEWFAIPSSRGSSWPRDRTVSLTSPELADGFFITRTTGEALMTSLNIILSRSIYVVSKAKFLFFPELRSYLFKTLFRWRTEMKLLSNKKYELNCCFF